ncbi:hypothetical protein ACN8ZM_18815 [Burkholderia aenigmatica]|uniref:hypothetical protein n=1 Tax=Burkholderia aenigmatica TaxID=2015348 RepID=UPI003B43925A
MVMDIKNIYEFTFSSPYQEVLDELCEIGGISIHEKYDDVIFNFDKIRIENSGINPGEIEGLVIVKNRRFIDFCAAKIGFFKTQEARQDFPKGEEVEDFDQKEKLIGFSRGILLMYGIEFLLGLKGQQVLESYVKKSRIPGAKKYVKDVLALINQSA